ncbi:MAG: YkgJ family cysteine cluster protein [Bacillota bacterium]
MNTAIDEYRRLRDRVDQRVDALVESHRRHLACRPGCYECCTNLTVFPVEYHAILAMLRDMGISRLAFDPAAACGFLKDGLCVLYAFRPLICRTHGLPIAFLNEETSPPEYSVSFCPLNFSHVDVEELVFGPDNTLDLDQLNTALFEINLKFIRECPELGFEPTSRIPLGQLATDL